MTPNETRTQTIQRVYKLFSTEIKSAFDGDIDPSAWVSIVSNMMALMKRIEIPNQDKKKILIDVIKSVISVEVAENRRENALMVIDTIISPGIDLAASFNKGSVKKYLKMCC